MGVELSPGDSYTLSSAPVSFSENKNLLVKYYEATDKIVLKACTNDESNCKDISNPGIAREDKNPGWKTVNYPLTSDTRKVSF